jgi:hypothetical protein
MYYRSFICASKKKLRVKKTYTFQHNFWFQLSGAISHRKVRRELEHELANYGSSELGRFLKRMVVADTQSFFENL